jgi:hypothetical protein
VLGRGHKDRPWGTRKGHAERARRQWTWLGWPGRALGGWCAQLGWMVRRVWGVCPCGARGVIVGLVCGLGWGSGERRAKKLHYPVAPLEIADFRGE